MYMAGGVKRFSEEVLSLAFPRSVGLTEGPWRAIVSTPGSEGRMLLKRAGWNWI